MDPAPCPAAMADHLLLTPDHHPHFLIPDQPIKPPVLIFDGMVKPNPSLLSSTISVDDQRHVQASAVISCTAPAADNCSSAAAVEGDQTGAAVEGGQKGVITGSSYQSGSSAAEAGELCRPKLTELDDRPLSPDYHKYMVIKQMISKSTYLFPKQSEVNYRPQISESDAEISKRKVISESADQSAKQIKEKDDRASKPTNESAGKAEKMQVIREAAYQSGSEAKLDEKCTAASSADHHQGALQQKPKAIRDTLSEMSGGYSKSARGRLSRVVEESESFSRREFGANVLNYMSTHSSATHAGNLSNLSPYNHHDYSNFSSTHTSYHRNHYNLPDNLVNSKSAPAGTAARSGSTFNFFRRGRSEGGLGGRAVYHRPRSRKQRSLGSRLLWPLLKIRNGYVGCMMGLEGAGDLSGMAQGGTYATAARYFADVPLSKIDSRNHG